MVYLKRFLYKNSYLFFNNRLYIKNRNNDFIRIKQKLPEFIEDIDDLKKYDYFYLKNKK